MRDSFSALQLVSLRPARGRAARRASAARPAQTSDRMAGPAPLSGAPPRGPHGPVPRVHGGLGGDTRRFDAPDRPLRGGPFALQAAIAAVHARARRKEDTDWAEIVRIYERLERVQATQVVTLNRAVAVAMVEGPRAALAIVDALAKDGALDEYHLLHAARADFARRLGDRVAAAKSYRRALQLVGNDSERRFLERRLREVE